MSDICRAPYCKNIRDKNQSSRLCVMHRVRWSRFKSYDLPSKYPEGKIKLCKIHGFLSIDQCLKRTCDKWYICKECNHRRSNARYARNKHKWHNQKRNFIFIGKSGLKIHKDQYEKMHDKQKGLCALCGNKEKVINHKSKDKTPRKLAIDHCHKTGKIRELLCYACNVSLGKFDDSIENLQSAIAYLKKHQQID
jgi:hypothetical protein